MSSRNTGIKRFYNMDETRLKIVTSEKDLGIVLKDDLSFDEHIAAKVKKATSLVGLIRSFTHLDINMFRTLFTAIIRPHLEYGAPISVADRDVVNIVISQGPISPRETFYKKRF